MIDIPSRYTMNRSAADMAYLTTMSKVVYPPVRPNAPFYPQSPYAGMGRLRGDGTIPGPPFCTDIGTYAQESAYFGFTDCSPYLVAGDVAGAYRCSQSNLGPQAALANFQIGCSYPPNYIGGPPGSPAGSTTGGGTGISYGPNNQIPVGTIAYNPTLTFASSRGGTTLQPGDTWTIRITGAQPGSIVSVTGGQNGANIANNMGVTDATGSWSMTGSIDATEIGSWSERWAVAGQNAGTVAFTVVPAGGAVQTQGNTPSGTPYNPTVTFTPSRTGTLQPGDTWTIRITGGMPRSSVTVVGGQNGSTQTNTMGVTDQYGNFSLQGTIDSTSVGSWQETWYVAGQSAGSFSFNVAAPSASGGGTTGGTGSGAPPAGGGNSGGTGSTTVAGIPTEYLLIGGGALLLLLVVAGGK